MPVSTPPTPARTEPRASGRPALRAGVSVRAWRVLVALWAVATLGGVASLLLEPTALHGLWVGVGVTALVVTTQSLRTARIQGRGSH